MMKPPLFQFVSRALHRSARYALVLLMLTSLFTSVAPRAQAETEERQVWVEGYWDSRHHEGYWDTVRHEGYWDMVWRDGYWDVVHHDGYWDTVHHDGYWDTIYHDGSWEEVTHEGHWEGYWDEYGNWCDVWVDGYTEWIWHDGYEETVWRDGYDEPVWRDGYDEPVWRDGYHEAVWRDAWDEQVWRDAWNEPYWVPGYWTTVTVEWSDFSEPVGDWHEESGWSPGTDSVPSGESFTQERTLARSVRTGQRSDTGEERNVNTGTETMTETREATGTGTPPPPPPPTGPVIQGSVTLSAYTFDRSNPPFISTDATFPGRYKLRAKIIDGSQYGFHAAVDSEGNNATRLVNLHQLAPGTYTVALYWLCWDAQGTVSIGPETTRTITIPHVALSSYVVDPNNLPTIYTFQPLSGRYKLRAKFIDGSQYGFHAASDSEGNNNTRLVGLPSTPGNYNVALYWLTWDATGNMIVGPESLVTVTVTPPTPPRKPLVILAPSSPNVVAGGTVTLTVVGYGEPTVQEVGVEACDANGNVTANLGSVAVSDSYGEHAVTWTAPAPGLYYFCGYVWNADRTVRERTSPIAVGVYTEPDSTTVDEDDWGDSDWGGDDWGTPDENCGYYDAQGNRHVTYNGHNYSINRDGTVTRFVTSGPFSGAYTFRNNGSGQWTVTTPFGTNYAVDVNYDNQTFRLNPVPGSPGASSNPLPTAGTVSGNRAIEQNVASRLGFPLLEDGDTVLLPQIVVTDSRLSNFDVDSYVGMHVMLKYYASPQLAATGVVPGPGPVDMNSVSERERQRQYLVILERLIAEGKMQEQTRLYGPLTAQEAQTMNERLGKVHSFREGVADSLVGAGVGAATTKNPYGALIGMGAGVLLNMFDVFHAPTQLREGDIMVFTTYISYAGRNRSIPIGTAINYYVFNQNVNLFSNQTGQTRFELTQPAEPLYKAVLREVFNGGGQPNPPAPPAGRTVLTRDPATGRIVFKLEPTG